MFRKLLYIISFLAISTGLDAQQDAKPFKIVIDPGHGGKDVGCVGTGKNYEKNIVLSIALKLGNLIENNCKDVKVIYTRKTDVFIKLDERTAIANKEKADLFMSIHVDAIDRNNKNAPLTMGFSTFTLGSAKNENNLAVAKRENAVILMEDNYETTYQGFDPNSAESYIMFENLQGAHQAQSIHFASIIQQQVKEKANRKDREVRQGPYLVLSTASMPAVLVETGFMSNLKEEKYLMSEEGRTQIAQALYNAFMEYKKDYDRKNNSKMIVQEEKKESISKNEVVYKIQILTSGKILKKNDPLLKGLWPVSYFQENGVYKYTYGESQEFEEISKTLKQTKNSFKDSFIVRFKDGTRVK